MTVIEIGLEVTIRCNVCNFIFISVFGRSGNQSMLCWDQVFNAYQHLNSHVSQGSYLIVITEREAVGSYFGHPIFRVSSLKVYPCDHSLKHSPNEQVCLCASLPFIFP